jgi:hypothetical protein
MADAVTKAAGAATDAVKGTASKAWNFAASKRGIAAIVAFTAACYFLAPAGAIAATTKTLPAATTAGQVASNAGATLKATYAAGAPEVAAKAQGAVAKFGNWLLSLTHG